MSPSQGSRSFLTRAGPLLLFWSLLRCAGVYGAITQKGSACTARLDEMLFCVNATVENDLATYELTSMRNLPADVGWMAIGFGESMVNTHMVIMWQNEDKTMTVSQRYARWYSEPFVLADPPRNATAIEPQLNVWQPKNSTTFAFTIPAEPALLNGTTKQEQMIWATSPMRPGPNYLAHIARHWEKGHMKFQWEHLAPQAPAPAAPVMPAPPSEQPNPGQDAHTGQNPAQGGDSGKDSSPTGSAGAADKGKPAAGSSPSPGHTTSGTVTEETKHDHEHGVHDRAVRAHGVLLSFGFLFLLPIGVLAGRWGRVLSPVWFKVHWVLNMAVAAPVIALGWALGPVSVYQRNGPHLNDAHKICGVILLGLYIGQVLMGRYIHKRRVESPVPITNHHPPLNIAHVAFGLLFITFSFFQVRSGLAKLEEDDEAPRWSFKLWAIWAAVLPFLYIVGLTLVPRQFKQERSGGLGGLKPPQTYLPLGETSQRERDPNDPSSSTALMFEIGRDEGDDDDDDNTVFGRDEKKDLGPDGPGRNEDEERQR